jgi:hypothetical protein
MAKAHSLDTPPQSLFKSGEARTFFLLLSSFAAKPGGGLRPFQPHVLVVSKMAPKAFRVFLQ